MDADAIIAQCTRNGVTSWQNVARQLGRSVDSVRCAYDPQYLHIRPWPHLCEVVPHPDESLEDLAVPNDADIPTNSPHAKGPGLKLEILRFLQNGSQSAEIIASVLIRPVNSIRARLDRLQGDFLVCNDGRYPRTWSLTAKGLRIAVTGCEVRERQRA